MFLVILKNNMKLLILIIILGLFGCEREGKIFRKFDIETNTELQSECKAELDSYSENGIFYVITDDRCQIINIKEELK